MMSDLPQPCSALLAAAGNEALLVLAAAGAVSVVFLVVLLVVVKRMLIVCPPNRVAVLSGRPHRRPDGTIVGYRVIRGGRVMRLPFIERIDFLDLSGIPLEIRVREAWTRGASEAIAVELSASVKISSDPVRVHHAVERFLGRDRADVERVVRDTLEGCARAVLATVTPDEVRSDRVRFEQAVFEEAAPQCNKLGIDLEGLNLLRIGAADDGGSGRSPMAVPVGV